MLYLQKTHFWWKIFLLKRQWSERTSQRLTCRPHICVFNSVISTFLDLDEEKHSSTMASWKQFLSCFNYDLGIKTVLVYVVQTKSNTLDFLILTQAPKFERLQDWTKKKLKKIIYIYITIYYNHHYLMGSS